MSLVIKGASLLGESSAELYVENGVLVTEAPTGAEVIDADGLVALPGLVDLHTHLREPGREDAETVLTGSKAAALGGFTAVLAMVNTSPEPVSNMVVSTGEDIATVGLLALAIANPVVAVLIASILVIASLWLVVSARRLFRRALNRS